LSSGPTRLARRSTSHLVWRRTSTQLLTLLDHRFGFPSKQVGTLAKLTTLLRRHARAFSDCLRVVTSLPRIGRSATLALSIPDRSAAQMQVIHAAILVYRFPLNLRPPDDLTAAGADPTLAMSSVHLRRRIET